MSNNYRIVILFGDYVVNLLCHIVDLRENMKNVRIHITELGPIREQEIQLAPMMLFTGDSNLGKSYTNFLCYYVFNLSVSDRLDEFLQPRMLGYTDEVDKFSFSIKKDDLRLWMESDVRRFMAYLLAYQDINCNVHFYFDDAPDVMNVDIEEHSVDDKDVKSIPVSVRVDDQEISFRAILGDKKADVLRWIKFRLMRELTGETVISSLLMPPGRASLLSGSFTTQKGSSKMGLYEIFLGDNDMINFRGLKMASMKEEQQFFLSRIRKLIGGDFVFGQNGLELKLPTGQLIPIEAAASSIKELAPILVWIKGSNTMQYDSICIEEPEAHCHPLMQSQLADLLVACVNKGALMQITTHSDYLLKRLNQLLRLHDWQIEHPERYNIFCKTFEHTRSLTLNKDKIKAYYFHYSEEERTTKIELQDLSGGIPFDSFAHIIDNEMAFDDFWEGEYENL